VTFHENSTEDVGVKVLLGPSPYQDFMSSQNITSPVLSLTFEQGSTRPEVKDLIYPIIFSIPIPSPGLDMKTLNRNESQRGFRPFCKYWDEKTLEWKTNGCRMMDFNETFVTCACNHTTNFAAFIEFAIPNLQFLDAQDFRNITKLNKDNMATVILMASLALCYIVLVIIMNIYNFVKWKFALAMKKTLHDAKNSRHTHDGRTEEKSKGRFRVIIFSFLSEHPYLAFFMGPENSFGKIRRLTIIYAGILGIFTGNAITFGTEIENGVQFLVSSVVSEIISAPFVMFFTMLFVSTKALPSFKKEVKVDTVDPGPTFGYCQPTNYPKNSRFHGVFTPGSLDPVATDLSPQGRRFSKLRKQLVRALSKVLDFGDSITNAVLTRCRAFLDRITWQGAIIIFFISLIYGGCVVGVMFLFQCNFGSWFNADYQFGLGTLFVVAYFVFLEVTYIRIRYRKFVNRDVLQWRPKLRAFGIMSLIGLSFLLLACGLIPVLILVTPSIRHPWFLRVFFIELGIVVIALSTFVFMFVLSWNLTHSSVADDESHLPKSTWYELDSVSSEFIGAKSQRIIDEQERGTNQCMSDDASNTTTTNSNVKRKSLLKHLSDWWNADYWFSWPCLILWYILFAIYIFGCSFVLVLYGIKFDQQTSGWLLGCGSGVAQDIFVKPVIEFVVHNVVYVAILECLAGMFLNKRVRFDHGPKVTERQ